MKLAGAQALEQRHLVSTYDRLPVLLERGKGAYVYDERGKRYLDFLSGIGVNALGYDHPTISQAIAQQSRKLVHTSNLFFHEYQGRLAEKLAEISGLDRVFFCNSGTEAWEAALKFARAFASSNAAKKKGAAAKWRVLAMSGAFHGRTFGSLATTSTAKYRKPFTPLLPGVKFVRFNDVDDLKRKFDDSVCAVAMETVQGEGGIQPVDAKFLRVARELTHKSGALLLLDEIQSGLGRTGKYFAYQHYDVKPDITTVAKPLAAGLPLGAMITTDRVAKCISFGMHGTTFGGGPLACSVALKFLETIEEENLLKHVKRKGELLVNKLEEIQRVNKHVVGVRGLGLMAAMELDSAELAKQTVKKMLESGVIINRTHETVLRFLPPYIITAEQVEEMTARLAEALGAEAGGRKKRGK